MPTKTNELREIVWSQILDRTDVMSLYNHMYVEMPEKFVNIWNLQEALNCFILTEHKWKIKSIPTPKIQDGFLRWGAWTIAKGEKETASCLEIIEDIINLQSKLSLSYPNGPSNK